MQNANQIMEEVTAVQAQIRAIEGQLYELMAPPATVDHGQRRPSPEEMDRRQADEVRFRRELSTAKARNSELVLQYNAAVAQREAARHAPPAVDTKRSEHFDKLHAAALRRIPELQAQRTPHVAAALSGDHKAKATCDELTAQIAAEQRIADDSLIARQEAQKDEAAEQREAMGRDADRRFGEAKKIAAEILEQSVAIDSALAMVGVALQRRHDLRKALVKTGMIDSNYSNRLSIKEPVDRALAQSGIGKFAHIGDGGASANECATLAAQDTNALTSIRRPVIEPAQSAA